MARANGIADPDVIEAGRTLKVPAPSAGRDDMSCSQGWAAEKAE